MAETAGSYAIDEAGIRRFIAPGDPVPEGWTVESEDDEPQASEHKAPSTKHAATRKKT
jgi:hypothetical protein